MYVSSSIFKIKKFKKDYKSHFIQFLKILILTQVAKILFSEVYLNSISMLKQLGVNYSNQSCVKLS